MLYTSALGVRYLIEFPGDRVESDLGNISIVY